jgi:glycerol uptake facilitator protein
MAYLGRLSWDLVPVYLLAQTAGAFTGAVCTWLIYKMHFDEATNAAEIKAVFCTAPAIRHYGWNFMTEMLATFAFMLGVLYLAAAKEDMGSLQALPVAFLVLGIGLSLGGPTGYAINPARDLGPRIAHFLLPIPGKGVSDWKYAWVPIAGPLVGGGLATFVYHSLTTV